MKIIFPVKMNAVYDIHNFSNDFDKIWPTIYKYNNYVLFTQMSLYQTVKIVLSQ